jgi:hypothetical protein
MNITTPGIVTTIEVATSQPGELSARLAFGAKLRAP